FIFLLLVALTGCDKEDAPDCFQAAGVMVTREVEVEPFHELIVHKGIRLFIQQGEEHKVVIETGKNLLGDISAEVENERLILRNANDCNFFRDYNITAVYVTVPDLSWLQNAG